ncbi:hypothetical protein [Actinoplanes regularis]|uniref:hypothetical protein n=1 Tax=Actinoplanes regularis TaxID=52697 RepID=UPI0024A5926A|nr:hypothetical protein [Actinoplanes regularis]GLW32289.1 hypothetical protein Areg01_52280 [Actinoplanes regularis]
MNTASLVTFTIGFLTGATVFWHVSLAVERFRRARRDFRAARLGIRTLIEMLAKRAEEAIGWTIIGVAAVGAVFMFWHFQR